MFKSGWQPCFAHPHDRPRGPFGHRVLSGLHALLAWARTIQPHKVSESSARRCLEVSVSVLMVPPVPPCPYIPHHPRALWQTARMAHSENECEEGGWEVGDRGAVRPASGFDAP